MFRLVVFSFIVITILAQPSPSNSNSDTCDLPGFCAVIFDGHCTASQGECNSPQFLTNATDYGGDLCGPNCGCCSECFNCGSCVAAGGTCVPEGEYCSEPIEADCFGGCQCCIGKTTTTPSYSRTNSITSIGTTTSKTITQSTTITTPSPTPSPTPTNDTLCFQCYCNGISCNIGPYDRVSLTKGTCTNTPCGLTSRSVSVDENGIVRFFNSENCVLGSITLAQDTCDVYLGAFTQVSAGLCPLDPPILPCPEPTPSPSLSSTSSLTTSSNKMTQTSSSEPSRFTTSVVPTPTPTPTPPECSNRISQTCTSRSGICTDLNSCTNNLAFVESLCGDLDADCGCCYECVTDDTACQSEGGMCIASRDQCPNGFEPSELSCGISCKCCIPIPKSTTTPSPTPTPTPTPTQLECPARSDFGCGEFDGICASDEECPTDKVFSPNYCNSSDRSCGCCFNCITQTTTCGMEGGLCYHSNTTCPEGTTDSDFSCVFPSCRCCVPVTTSTMHTSSTFKTSSTTPTTTSTFRSTMSPTPTPTPTLEECPFRSDFLCERTGGSCTSGDECNANQLFDPNRCNSQDGECGCCSDCDTSLTCRARGGICINSHAPCFRGMSETNIACLDEGCKCCAPIITSPTLSPTPTPTSTVSSPMLTSTTSTTSVHSSSSIPTPTPTPTPRQEFCYEEYCSLSDCPNGPVSNRISYHIGDCAPLDSLNFRSVLFDTNPKFYAMENCMSLLSESSYSVCLSFGTLNIQLIAGACATEPPIIDCSTPTPTPTPTPVDDDCSCSLSKGYWSQKRFGFGKNNEAECLWPEGIWSNFTMPPSYLLFNQSICHNETTLFELMEENNPPNGVTITKDSWSFLKQYTALAANLANGMCDCAGQFDNCSLIIDFYNLLANETAITCEDPEDVFGSCNQTSECYVFCEISNVTCTWQHVIDNINLGYIGPGHCDDVEGCCENCELLAIENAVMTNGHVILNDEEKMAIAILNVIFAVAFLIFAIALAVLMCMYVCKSEAAYTKIR